MIFHNFAIMSYYSRRPVILLILHEALSCSVFPTHMPTSTFDPENLGQEHCQSVSGVQVFLIVASISSTFCLTVLKYLLFI